MKNISLSRIAKHGPAGFDFEQTRRTLVEGVRRFGDASITVSFEGYKKTIGGRVVLASKWQDVVLFEVYDTSATAVAEKLKEQLEDFKPLLNL